MSDLIAHIESNSNIHSVVIMSGKTNSFIAGADINELFKVFFIKNLFFLN